MAFKSHYNGTKKPIWVGSVCIPAGESRPVDERFIPKAVTVKKPDEGGAKSMFDGLNKDKSLALIKGFDQTQLQAALADEEANGKRKSVIEAINKALLAVQDNGDQDHQEALEAFSAHWSNQPMEAVKAHLASDEMQGEGKQEFAAILQSIIDQEEA